MESPDDGPSWLSDYGFTDFSSIEADIDAMAHYAQQLHADVVDNYVPHMYEVSDAMLVELPPVQGSFAQLHTFLTIEMQVRDAAHENIYGYANNSNAFATAAKTISQDYRGSDARSHAKVRDVEHAFTDATNPFRGEDGEPSA